MFSLINRVLGYFMPTAFADPPAGGTGSLMLTNPLGQNCVSLGCPVQSVINFVYTVSLPLCAIMVLWGGILMATSAGDPEKFGKGKKTLLYAAIGFMVIMLASGAAKSIQKFFGQ